MKRRRGKSLAKRKAQQRYMAKRKAEARAEGICLACLKHPSQEGKTRCRECSVKEYLRTWSKRHGEPGMCCGCGIRPAVPDRKKCHKCLTYHRLYQRRAHAKPERTKSVALRALSYRVMDQRELTEVLGIAHRSTLRIVNYLIGRGLVERGVLDADGQDRRYVRLTAAGRKAVTELPPVYARRAA